MRSTMREGERRRGNVQRGLLGRLGKRGGEDWAQNPKRSERRRRRRRARRRIQLGELPASVRTNTRTHTTRAQIRRTRTRRRRSERKRPARRGSEPWVSTPLASPLPPVLLRSPPPSLRALRALCLELRVSALHARTHTHTHTHVRRALPYLAWPPSLSFPFFSFPTSLVSLLWSNRF